jgi:hypothetical protein
MDILDDNFSLSEEEELSFSEIYAAVALNGEIIITIPKEEEERVKVGLKNFKAKQAAKLKAEGLVPDPSIFTFITRQPVDPDLEGDFIDLSIQLTRKSTVKIAKLRIPDQEM